MLWKVKPNFSDWNEMDKIEYVKAKLWLPLPPPPPYHIGNMGLGILKHLVTSSTRFQYLIVRSLVKDITRFQNFKQDKHILKGKGTIKGGNEQISCFDNMLNCLAKKKVNILHAMID